MDNWLVQTAWMLGLPATVSLGAVALVGYVFGQRTRPLASDQMQMRRELKRARGILRDLERVAQQVRQDLARHQGSLGQFRTRLRDLCESGEQEPIDVLTSETERLLEPTKQLSVKLAQAYEMIRLQANQLTSVSDVRTDELTGLGNRLALEEVLANQIEMQRRYGMICSVVMFDIDLLTRVNTTHGKSRGDEVLKQVGELLDQYTRESDLICRYGSEEFVAVLPGTNLAGAVAFAERLRISVEKFSPVTVSCGVAEITTDVELRGIIARTDAALYSAKTSGRNCVFQHTGRNVSRATPPQRLVIDEACTDSRDQAARETIRSVSQALGNSMRMDSPGRELNSVVSKAPDRQVDSLVAG